MFLCLRVGETNIYGGRYEGVLLSLSEKNNSVQDLKFVCLFL